MGKAIPAQHPAVVLRSHYAHLRNLLAIAAIAVVGLSAAVVTLAIGDNDPSVATSARSAEPASPVGSPRHFEGVEASTSATRALPPNTRFDGGPEEGTRGISSAQAPVTRYDGGPEEGARSLSFPEAPVTRYDGGPEEGTRSIN